MKLRPYQQEAVKATLSYFRKSRAPALLVLPTGAGKSLVIAELARLAKGRVLMLTHVAELVAQNADKYRQLRDDGSIFSAGLKAKDARGKVVFASIQSVAPNLDAFEDDFSLVVIDECHRIGPTEESQYRQVLAHFAKSLVLGLTATPYRLDSGWLYRFHAKGQVRSTEPKLFDYCIFELPLRRLIDQGYLTPVRLIPAPAIRYDFSEAVESWTEAALDRALAGQGQLTPAIVDHLVALCEGRRGVMIFAATRKHAWDILARLPEGEAALVLGDTPGPERKALIAAFKAQTLKYLVNVSVLTTGFDAPHVDVIALMRPTQSVSLFQQMVGRGLRLFEGKTDCLVLDYAGSGFDLFSPEVGEPRPAGTVPVTVPCPVCDFPNQFWGKVDEDGDVIEHFGRRCQGMTGPEQQCDYRFRFRLCNQCGGEADIAARHCPHCQAVMVDVDKQLREAMKSRDQHLFRVAEMETGLDDSGLRLCYRDLDGQPFTEYLKFKTKALRRFLAEANPAPGTLFLPDDKGLAAHLARLRQPRFLLLSKQRGWRLGQRIFDYQGRFADHQDLG
ncbi:DEAD/DEAH box helicase [Gallaecimonas kandeliae]|nr:DEAD/DEAH box helicase [Gallaecimonas kandeliae]WKE67401.1 DEAD/DEAH box helicase [Gallaecimonas kandeliae]